MISLLEKEKLSAKDLENIITLKYEESIHLEFKGADSLSSKDKVKNEIAKDISSFANSAGGYIIYGINEENHVASSFSFINGNIFTKEWLEQVIQTRIHRKIEGIRIIPIRIDDNIEKSIYLVKIPESTRAPHMTSDKRFYKRYNFESVQMEEYEIRNLYNRKEKTELEINGIISVGKPNIENDEDGRKTIFFPITFQICNKSKAIEKDYKLIISFNFSEFVIKWDRLEQIKPNLSLSQDGKKIISFSNTCSIFPEETLSIGSIDLGLTLSEIERISEKGELFLTLLYSNGQDNLKIRLNDFIDKYNSSNRNS